MKYIAKCVEQQHKCGYRDLCKHTKPHERREYCHSDWDTPCDCAPMDLEYYMKEIIKEHEEKEE